MVDIPRTYNALSPPVDPPSSEGTDEKLATMAFELRSEIARIQNARDAQIATLRAALESIRLKLSYACQDAVSPAAAQSNLNLAYHECVAALARKPT